MPRFLVEGDAVRRQATNVGVTVDGFRAALTRYHGAVESTYGTWLGVGSDTFRAFDGRFRAAAANLITALATMQTEVEAAGVAYNQNENEQQAAVSSLIASTALIGPNQQGDGPGPGIDGGIGEPNPGLGEPWGNPNSGSDGPKPPGAFTGFLESTQPDFLRGLQRSWGTADTFVDFLREGGRQGSEGFQSLGNSMYDSVIGSDGLQNLVNTGVDGAQSFVFGGWEAGNEIADGIVDGLFGAGEEPGRS